MAATQPQIDSTTQQFLDIFDITNDLVILKDGTASLLISVDAMNFGLLAEEEQDSIMYAYAGLLNSLNYPIQIVIISHTKDVTGYLRLLKEQEDAAVNRVQQQRIMKYREFVSNLIRERNVLDKKFYVAIPAKSLELGLAPMSSVIPGQSQTDISTVDKSMVIEKAKSILEPKRDHLIAQFARIGLYSRQLETQEIIQLFYQSYNPEAFEGQSMDDSRNYTAPLVSASIEEPNMDNQNPNQPTPVQSTPIQPVAPVMPVASETPITTATEEPSVQTPTLSSTPNPALGYTPTQMSSSVPSPTNQPSSTATLEPSTPSISVQDTSAPGTPTTNTSTSDSPMSITPTPPAPELPKTEPGQVDNSVPQEIEIEIKHNGGNVGSPANTENTSLDVQSSAQSSPTMPPLPDIK